MLDFGSGREKKKKMKKKKWKKGLKKKNGEDETLSVVLVGFYVTFY